ncbi:hypothetical protein H072_6602 [Dactylellina haptotyla CBS 200.50]|uniref:Alpha-1,3-mannosyltransferase CMT1 n=1 Tax=Dactylellina haptotyla (strain CBS 200.50) TaxID=1284197 RepID=S8AEN7_DACHA|nr:hypothetical protein H072_6602 [Dactylellina haptotyla CBS 200.50]
MALSRRFHRLRIGLILSIVGTFYLGYHLSSILRPKLSLKPARLTQLQGPIPPKKEWHPDPVRNGDLRLLAQGNQYVRMILDSTAINSTIHRLDCPRPKPGRYEYLANSVSETEGKYPSTRKPKYFFALNLFECRHILPTLLGSILEVVRMLGPEKCTLSIVEGRSNDGTFEVLKLLIPVFKQMGLKYYFGSNDINPKGDGSDRIISLAILRNLALKPLVQNANLYPLNIYQTTVIFINDVAICAEDILELLHQRRKQSAHMTCAMDWVSDGGAFYDVWVSRGMNGDLFFEIPQDASWSFAGNLFWNDQKTRGRLLGKVPFQVFSCWNGAVTFVADPIITGDIEFRSKALSGFREDGTRKAVECHLGEPVHLCKDLWYHNYNRIAVVPSVNLGYFVDSGNKTKSKNGWTSENIDLYEGKIDMDPSKWPGEMIKWDPKPPGTIKCIPIWHQTSWVPWDEGLDLLAAGNATTL